MEEDEKGKLTGRWQVGDEELEEVYDTFDTEEEAQKKMEEMQAEFDRDDKIEAEYLAWEKECMIRHNISQEDLRVFLVNGPAGK